MKAQPQVLDLISDQPRNRLYGGFSSWAGLGPAQTQEFNSSEKSALGEGLLGSFLHHGGTFSVQDFRPHTEFDASGGTFRFRWEGLLGPLSNAEEDGAITFD